MQENGDGSDFCVTTLELGTDWSARSPDYLGSPMILVTRLSRSPEKSLPSHSCSARGLRGSFGDFRIGAVLLGPQYGFPCSRVRLAWEPLFIQARSASKGIRGDCTSRAEQDCSRPHFRPGKRWRTGRAPRGGRRRLRGRGLWKGCLGTTDETEGVRPVATSF